MKEATAWIKADKKAAAEAYLRVTKDRMPVEEMIAILNDPRWSSPSCRRRRQDQRLPRPRRAASRQSPTIGRTIYFGDIDTAGGELTAADV